MVTYSTVSVEEAEKDSKAELSDSEASNPIEEEPEVENKVEDSSLEEKS